MGLGALRRVARVGRHQVHRALLEFDAIALAAIHDVEECVAFELPKIFLERIIVKVSAGVRPTDDGDDEIGVQPQLLIAGLSLPYSRKRHP